MSKFTLSFDGKDVGFDEVRTLDQAKNLFDYYNIDYDFICQQQIGMKYGEPEYGIHFYFMKGATDVGWYTPSISSVIMLEKPRPWHSDFLRTVKHVNI